MNTTSSRHTTTWTSSIWSKRCVVLLATLLVAAVSSGCAVSTRVDARLAASEDVNADDSGQAYPIVVRIYELKSRDAFVAADFFEIYDSEQTVLGESLISRSEAELVPGEVRRIKKELSEEALYLGVLAAYRDIESADWIKAITLRDKRTNLLNINVGRRSITVRSK